MDGFVSYNPELGFYAWVGTVAYILEQPVNDLWRRKEEWTAAFDAGLTPSEAIERAMLAARGAS